MHSYKELLNILTDKGPQGLRDDPELRGLFFREYRAIFGDACRNCDSKLAGYVKQFINHKNTSNMEKKNKFKLMKRLVAVDGLGHINQQNCTDEIAVKMLAISSGFLKYFESYPDDWDKLVTKERAKQSKAKAPAATTKVTPEVKAEEVTPEVTVEPTDADKYRDKLIALDGIAEITADKIIEGFPTEAALEAHIAAGKDLTFSPQANKALLENYGG
tara:strand:- start:849 stop:1499 length:651 start_codon:yes stop_codon:yes gene_type:complete